MAARKAPMTAETGDAVVNVEYFDTRINALKKEIIESLEKALAAHSETEVVRIEGIWHGIHWRDNVFIGSFAVLGAIVGIVTGIMSGVISLSGCTPVLSPPQETAIALNSTYAAGTATGNAVFIPTPEYDPTLTPTATETPRATEAPTPTSSIITATPRPSTTPVDHIIEVDTQEIEWLAALCWVEIRNFGDRRPGACASVIDTVMTRIKRHQMTGGDIFSTITYGCNEDSVTCQFPAYAVRGCDGIIPRACPFYDTEGMIYFRGIVLGYLEGSVKPLCAGRLYYGSRLVDRGDCEIVAPNGDIEAWHN